MNSHTHDHVNEKDKPTNDLPTSPAHGSFSLPASVLASDTIEQLLAFAFDVLDLSSIALRVYEPGDNVEDNH